MASKKSKKNRASELLRSKTMQLQEEVETKIQIDETTVQDDSVRGGEPIMANVNDDFNLDDLDLEGALGDLDTPQATTKEDEIDLSGFDPDKALDEETKATEETHHFDGDGNDLTDDEIKANKERKATERKARTQMQLDQLKKGEKLVAQYPNKTKLQNYMSERSELVFFITRDDAKTDLVQKKTAQREHTEGKGKGRYIQASTLQAKDVVPASERAYVFDFEIRMKQPSTPIGCGILVPADASSVLDSGIEPDLAQTTDILSNQNPEMKLVILDKDYPTWIASHFGPAGVAESPATFAPVAKNRKADSPTLSEPGRYIVDTRQSKKAIGDIIVDAKVYLKHNQGRSSLVTPTNYIPLNTFNLVPLTYEAVLGNLTEGVSEYPFFKQYLASKVPEANTIANKLQVPGLENLVDAAKNVYLTTDGVEVWSPLLSPKSEEEFNAAAKQVIVVDWARRDENGSLAEIPLTLPLKESRKSKETKTRYAITKNKLQLDQTYEKTETNPETGAKEKVMAESKYFWTGNPEIQRFVDACQGLLKYENLMSVETRTKNSKSILQSQESSWLRAQLTIANQEAAKADADLINA